MKNELKFLLVSDLNRIYKNQGKALQIEGSFPYFVIVKYVIFYRSFRAIFFYRLLNSYFKKKSSIRYFIQLISSLVNRVVIPYTVEIGEGLFLGHPECIIIHPDSIMGKNVTILHGVTIGGNIGKVKNGVKSPIIGDNVLIGAGAKILGPITIGDNSMIGANAVVTQDVPDNSVVVGVPGKVIKKVNESYIEIEDKMFFDSKK